jgi:outer membrane lipoprotein carrier protein
MKWMLALSLIFTVTVAAEPAETELRKLLRDYDGVTAKFSQQVVDSDGNKVHSANGELVFKQPGKFKWHVTAPDEELLISNGETLWWYNPFLEQVTLFNAKDSVSKTPFALLVSNRDETWNQFEIEKVESGFVIIPKDSENSQVLSLALSFEDFVLSQIVIQDRTRQLSQFTITEHQFNSGKNVNFDFVVPEDVEIDDQR